MGLGTASLLKCGWDRNLPRRRSRYTLRLKLPVMQSATRLSEGPPRSCSVDGFETRVNRIIVRLFFQVRDFRFFTFSLLSSVKSSYCAPRAKSTTSTSRLRKYNAERVAICKVLKNQTGVGKSIGSSFGKKAACLQRASRNFVRRAEATGA